MASHPAIMTFQALPSVSRRDFVACAGALSGLGVLSPAAFCGESNENESRPYLADDLTFRYGEVLSGAFHGGSEYGIELNKGIDGERVTRPGCMNLEHYFSLSQTGGLFAPRKGFQSIKRIDDRAIRVEIGGRPGWEVEATITYTLRRQCTIYTEFEVRFAADYRQFDTLLSNYVPQNAALPYLRIGGRWQQLKLSAPKEHRFWCRSEQDLANWRQALPAMKSEFVNFGWPNPLSLDDQVWNEPVMISPVRDTGWALVFWFDDNCRSLSANYFPGAHDFSIISRDVNKGEIIRAKAWMTYRKLENLDQALQRPTAA